MADPKKSLAGAQEKPTEKPAAGTRGRLADLKAEIEKGRLRKKIIDDAVKYFGGDMEGVWDPAEGHIDTPGARGSIDKMLEKVNDDVSFKLFLDYFGIFKSIDGVSIQIIALRVKELFRKQPENIEGYLTVIKEGRKENLLMDTLYKVITGDIGGFKFDEVVPKELLGTS